jgi:hypothetical protein
MDPHNEQVKLFATAVNNLGVAAIVAGIVAPTVNGTVRDAAHIVLWLSFGVSFVLAAQLILRRLR